MRRRTWAATAAAAALLLLSACGSDDGADVATANGEAPAGSESAPAELSEEEALRLFVDCMREQGVDMPDPGPGGNMLELRDYFIDNPEAVDACRDKLPGGGEPAELDPAAQEQMQKFVDCMREQGVDMPDPTADGKPQFDPELLDDPDFKTAMNACQDLLSGLRGE
ncbi:hypothetical protein AB0I28_07070 [Phytomonospora sp. NPDC050363]|uniref:hypothetical protein n=1 Tax=Phytomonospora sp. NPDC050363 TaxID=3155642 RepID=UPI0034083915